MFYERLPLSKTPNPEILTPVVLRRANIGEDYWDASLDAIPDRFPYKDEVEGYVMLMHRLERAGLGMALSGPFGTGKTALGCIVLKEALMRRARCYTVRCSTMVDRLWSKQPTFLPNGAPFREGVENVNYLFIDDFEVYAPGSAFNAKDQAVEQVIRARTERRLPTIIATNLGWDRLIELGYLGSLFDKWFWPYNVTGIDWRKNPPVA